MSYWVETRLKNGKEYRIWTVYLGSDESGRRIRRRVKSEAAAKRLEATWKAGRTEIDRKWFSLPLATKMEIMTVLGMCAKHSISLTESFETWFSTVGHKKTKTVSECAGLFLAFLKETNKRETYFKSFRQWLAFLCDRFGAVPMGGVTKEMLFDIYNEIPVRSRQTWRSRASTFWGFAKRNGHAEINLAELLDIPSLDKEIPHILTVSQCRTLLRDCPVQSLGALILMLFAGLRPSEAKQIEARAISLEKRTITVGGAIAKTRSYRLIPITSNMASWFIYLEEKNQPFPYRQANKKITEGWAKILGLPSWPRDCLRHTAASMMLARDKNADKVSLELGNSPGVLHRHYKNLVSDSDCDAFWRLTPVSSGRELLRKRKQLTSKSGLEYID